MSKAPQLNLTPSTDNAGVVGYNVHGSINETLGPVFVQITGQGWIDITARAVIRYTYAVTGFPGDSIL